MIRNLTRDAVVARRPRPADTLWWRLRGMIRRDFSQFDALVFPRCGDIHTCFMGQAIDVVFLDRDMRVVGLRQALRPWRLASARRARTVVEMAANTLPLHASAVGDQWIIEPFGTA